MPLLDVLRGDQPVWLSSREEFAGRYSELAARVEHHPEYKIACLPVRAGGRCAGAVTFTFGASGGFDRAEQDFLLNIARQGSLALERSQLLEAEQHAHSQVERAVRARDDLLAVVSHDLRNPLGVVSMKASAIERALPAGEPNCARARRWASGIQSSVARMEELIGDLLDLGSIEAGQLKLEPVPHDLGTLLATTIDDLQTLAGSKGVRVEAEPPDEPLSVRCDPRRVRQVLSNLVGNGIKFTPTGGVVVVRPARDGGMARVMVSDTGRGIDGRDLGRIFDRYYQAPTSERSGVGLGLFISKGIVEAHGGRIWAESAPGAGSRFYFTLPLDSGGGAELHR